MVMNLSSTFKMVCLQHEVAVSDRASLVPSAQAKSSIKMEALNMTWRHLPEAATWSMDFRRRFRFAFASYRRKETVQNLNLDTTNDQAQITRRTSLLISPALRLLRIISRCKQ